MDMGIIKKKHKSGTALQIVKQFRLVYDGG